MDYDSEMKAVFGSLSVDLQARLLNLGKTLLASNPKECATLPALPPGKRRKSALYLVENTLNKKPIGIVADAVKRKKP